MSFNKEGFGKILQERLTALHLTQAQLAYLVGCGKDSISNYVNGKGFPRLDRLIRITEALGITLPDFIGKVKEHPENIVTVPILTGIPRDLSIAKDCVEATENLYFARGFFEEDNLYAFTVSTSHMHDRLCVGSLAVVAVNTKPRTGQIAAIRYKGLLMVSRIVWKDKKDYVLVPTNPVHDVIEVDSSLRKTYPIVGTVLFSYVDYRT